MPILTQIYSQAGSVLGRPQIAESGVATDDAATMNDLDYYETGRVELVPLPRTQGLVAKALDGQIIRTTLIRTDLFGNFRNCMQLGRTAISRLAPRQPIGPHQGRQIVNYQRVWVSLED